ncbi:MAG: sulfurtransferase TusA family protein [Bacteroidetes bacterium]|nr:MAG: sulfurtransferase TusA family protein [Bacteroidota bacterium]
MNKDELKALSIDKVVDARGTACPGPLMATKKTIGEMKPGEIVEVLSSDPATKRDVPKWAEKKGFTYLGDILEDGYFRLYIKK